MAPVPMAMPVVVMAGMILMPIMIMPVVIMAVVIVAGMILMPIMIMAGMVMAVVIVAGMILMPIMIMAGMVMAVVIMAGMVMAVVIMAGMVVMLIMIMAVGTVLVSMPIRHRTHLSTEVIGDQSSSSLPQRPTRIGVDYAEYRRGPPRAFPAAIVSCRASTRRGGARFDTSHERSTTLASTMATEVGG